MHHPDDVIPFAIISYRVNPVPTTMCHSFTITSGIFLLFRDSPVYSGQESGLNGIANSIGIGLLGLSLYIYIYIHMYIYIYFTRITNYTYINMKRAHTGTWRERDRETETETDRQTDRQRQRERQRQSPRVFCLLYFISFFLAEAVYYELTLYSPLIMYISLCVRWAHRPADQRHWLHQPRGAQAGPVVNDHETPVQASEDQYKFTCICQLFINCTFCVSKYHLQVGNPLRACQSCFVSIIKYYFRKVAFGHTPQCSRVLAVTGDPAF